MATTSVGAGSNIGLVDQITAIHNSIMGYVELCPSCVRKFEDKECHDKLPNETYKDYCQRLQGSGFNYAKWKNLCYFCWKQFEADKNSNKMDLTTLRFLFNVLFKTKKDSRDPSALMEKLRTLKNLRNGVMHDIKKASDPLALEKLEAALENFIQEAGVFYSLHADEEQKIINEMKTDIKAEFSPGKKQLLYAKACMVSEGWDSVKDFVQSHFETESLTFNMSEVERTTVFYEPQVILTEKENNEIFPYSKIFDRTEKFIIVSGVAGAGKSTLLENVALQFVKPQPGTSTRLLDFELLVYIQCRDNTIRTLSHVIEQQFHDVCIKFEENLVLFALFRLSVLFLVDGFDEYNHQMTVLQEVIKKTQMQSNCQIVITTRPHAVSRLKRLLSVNNAVEFEIAPLEKLEQQLNFLEKYELHLHSHQLSVRESFKTLEEQVRLAFTEPLKLLQFCDISIAHPDRIAKWKRMNDVAKDIFIAYKDRITQKVTNISLADADDVIDDLLLVIYEVALDFLRINSLSFTEDQFKQVRQKCRSKLQVENIPMDPKLVLSCVFKLKRLLNSRRGPTYMFHHKTDQEYFASKGIVDKMKSSDLCLKDISGDSSMENSFLELLQYVVQDLSADSPKLFRKRWPELKEELQKAGATFSTWCNLVFSSSDDDNVIKRAAEAAINVRKDYWEAKNSQDVDAFALMLPHHQPNVLCVKLHPQALRRTRWA